MSAVTLSVILTNYTDSRYIGKALEDMLHQSFKPFEVIVVNHGFTEEMMTTVEQFSHRIPSLRLLQVDKQMRDPVLVMNQALKDASGDHVYCMRSGDHVLPGFFERSVGMLSQYPYAGLCSANPAQFDDRSGAVDEHWNFWSDKSCYLSPEETVDAVRGGDGISIHASLIRRSALLEAGGFIPELKWYADWFAWLVVAFRHGICYIPEPLAARDAILDSISGIVQQSWSFQHSALRELLRLIKSSDYCDVLPLFARGSVMSHFGSEIVRFVTGNPEHWDVQTQMLIQEPLWSWNQSFNQEQEAKRTKLQTAMIEDKIGAAFVLGNFAILQGQYDEAFSIFEELIRDFPNLISAYVSLASVGLTMKKFRVACEALTVAIKLNPNDPNLYNQLGIALSHAGDLDRAKKCFHKVLALDPNNQEAHKNLKQMTRA